MDSLVNLKSSYKNVKLSNVFKIPYKDKETSDTLLNQKIKKMNKLVIQPL